MLSDEQKQQLKIYAYRVLDWLSTEPSRLAAEWRDDANRRSIILIVAGGLVAILAYVLIVAPPDDFPTGRLVEVPKGSSAGEVAQLLEEQGVVRSSVSLRLAMQVLGRDRGVRAGDYLFKEPTHLFSVARRITTGTFGLEPVRIRVPEGATARDMGKLFAAYLQRIDEDTFARKARSEEGYLFPDTYFFLPNATEDIVIDTMRQNFDVQIKMVTEDIEESGHSLEDVVIMASILEKEAHNHTDRRRIAGVLWRRIKIDMALQVDAAFLYSLGRTTFELTKEDLQDEDDPYNTYANKGLPPGPIGSPSLSSLQAAVNPIDEGYLFYLADRNHVTYYAKTYEGHLRNRELYLGR